ncbi:YigZ family protein [Actinobacillus equuli subsp. haemolyticus]|uniref:YigZ family protein n=1 Tax=Actinobacillus equuli TaxID=718 RepID=UPI002442A0C4|nr:YigZ family protein [Actinobacillus equuli]WGE42051.1 YigZ family protein [Actinobacillus equuli subsp. haemolyticus]WGE52765.1 YigZ family protein [Actinobacillus equuli subsp. haemolyticus]WGE63029.1 YigZ family protein [Actinobacillus equuli subsp. haemolyticus]WGE73208.1 YigZ family protein [Actinobacillus equuli subsp. haemolyticus]WGE79150.1 YigZ family protein [Actinobacillus equuli subsp. equuli]
MEYFIPQQPVIFEEEIKKSRFITYLRHTEGMEQAKAFWAEMKMLHPQARHWCWATVAGMPNDSQQYGFSDDGEPSGTAGKPMLNYLLGSGLGEITTVVVRYYGGIQLGTGGLVKAYGGGVQQALLQVEKQRKVLRQNYRLVCEYDQFNTVQHLLNSYDIELLEQHFTEVIELNLAINPADIAPLSEQLTQRFSGKLQLNKPD